jgi:putative lipoprotein
MNTRKLAILIAATLTACAPTTSGIEPQAFDLAGSEWAPENGPEAQFIQFQTDGNVSGNGACNRFGGTYTQEGNKLSFGPLMSTKMACLDMNKETAFFNALDQVNSFEGDHLKLVLKSGTDDALLTLIRRDWD